MLKCKITIEEQKNEVDDGRNFLPVRYYIFRSKYCANFLHLYLDSALRIFSYCLFGAVQIYMCKLYFFLYDCFKTCAYL